ncbi:MAG TPA: MotA/TolQ/ExbB proton channel family protein [Deltaproteobacteria bacterium]|nr:MotA/TolQ/ExbB proton channel family protein [Deltaproteobacteria bacterium]
MLERARSFSRFRASVADFRERLAAAACESGGEGAARLCEAADNPLARVCAAGLARRGEGRDEVLRAMELAARIEMASLERFLSVLGSIGSTAPFIGLFGTVLGIIRAFGDLSAAEGAGPAAVADGIAEALVATAAGLFVAVPAVIAYNMFVRTLKRRALELEASAVEFAAVVAAGGEGGMEADKR